MMLAIQKLNTSSISKALLDIGQDPHPFWASVQRDQTGWAPTSDILWVRQHLSWSRCPHSLCSLPSHSRPHSPVAGWGVGGGGTVLSELVRLKRPYSLRSVSTP